MKERKNSEFRIQNSELRSGKPGRWTALLAVLLAAGCATPKAAQFTDADWVSQSTTGRGAYERGDYRRAAEAYGRAERRAHARSFSRSTAICKVSASPPGG